MKAPKIDSNSLKIWNSTVAKGQPGSSKPNPDFIPATKRASPFCHLIIEDGIIQLATPGFTPLDLEMIKADISLFNYTVNIKASGKKKNCENDFFHLTALLSIPDSNIDFDIGVNNLSSDEREQIASVFFPEFRGLKIIDEPLDIKDIKIKGRSISDHLALHFEARSSLFSLLIEAELTPTHFVLTSPGLVQFHIPPNRLKDFSKEFFGQLKVDTFSVPLKAKEETAFQATLKGSELCFQNHTLQPFSLFVSTNNFKTRTFTVKVDSPQIQLSSSLYLPDEWRNLVVDGQALFPANVEMRFSAKTVNDITGTLEGDGWQTPFSGGYEPQTNSLFLRDSIDLFYTFSQFPSQFPRELDLNHLKKPVSLHLEIQPFHISLPSLTGPISATLRFEPFYLNHMNVGETTAVFYGDLKNPFFDFSSTLEQGVLKSSGSFTLGLSSGIDTIAAQFFFDQLPNRFLDFVGLQAIAPILGTTLNGSLDLLLSSEENRGFLQLSTDFFHTSLSLKQETHSLQLAAPARFSLSLTPEHYPLFSRWINPSAAPFILKKPLNIDITVPTLQWPLITDADGMIKPSDDFSSIGCELHLSTTPLSFFTSTSQPPVGLDHINIHLQYGLEKRPFTFSLETKEVGGSLQGAFDLKNGNGEFQGNLSQFPSEVIDFFFHLIGKKQLSAASLFGPQLNFSINSSLKQWSGTVNFKLDSSYLSSSLNGSIIDGVLTLKEPFRLQASLTHDLTGKIFSVLNPLSLSSVASANNIMLEIPYQGFSYPVYPKNLTRITIPSGRLTLGKIYSRNEGNLKTALELLRLTEFSPNDDLELWFTPLDFHVQNGILESERTEIFLANTYQICTWGKINFLVNDIDMNIGVTSPCLKKIFGIKNLPKNYLFSIPMKGPLNLASINAPKTAAKIAALLLWGEKNKSKNSKKTSKGIFLDQFVNKLTPLPDEELSTPPPKLPFPWQELHGETDETPE